MNDEGYREILGVAEGSREDKESWINFLRYLKERGLKGVRLIVSDKCLGLYEIIGDFFPEAKWQRCIVHWYRNAFTMCPWKHLREVVAMLKAIHAQEDKDAARQKAALVAEKLRAMKLERIASFVETSVEETLSSQPTCSSGALCSVGCFGCAKSRLSSVITQKQMCVKLRILPSKINFSGVCPVSPI